MPAVAAASPALLAIAELIAASSPSAARLLDELDAAVAFFFFLAPCSGVVEEELALCFLPLPGAFSSPSCSPLLSPLSQSLRPLEGDSTVSGV